MEALKDATHLVASKQRFVSQISADIGRLIEACYIIKEDLDATPDLENPDKMDIDTISDISSFEKLERIKEQAAQCRADLAFSSGEKELHSAINKLGKAIDHTLEPNPGRLSFGVEFPQENVNKWIIEYILRQGNMELAHSFAKEADMSLQENDIRPFMGMQQCIAALRSGNCTPALEWARANSAALQTHRSNILFQLLRLEYAILLHRGQSNEALLYAQQNFPPHFGTEAAEVQRLMAALIYVQRLEQSPYQDLARVDDIAETVIVQFCRDYCRVFNLPAQSPLLLCAKASASAFGPLMKAKQITEQTQGPNNNWSEMQKLPVEIMLPAREFAFHSVFFCPVSKDLATDTNPPVILPCGHVITKTSLHEHDAVMSRNQFTIGRLKCPYCPQKIRVSEAKEIQF